MSRHPLVSLACAALLSGISLGCNQTLVLPDVAETRLVFDEAEVADYHVTIAPSDWQSIIDSRGFFDENDDGEFGNPREEDYRPATLQWKGETFSRIGVRAAGEGGRSAGNQKQSVKMKFDAFIRGQRFHGLRTLKLDGLHDPSMLRDRLSYGIYRARMPVAPRCVHGRLFVNGEYRGLYAVEQRVDDVLVQTGFGGDLGNLYRLQGEGTLWAGPDVANYVPGIWVPQTNSRTADHGLVADYVNRLNNAPATFPSVGDVPTLLEYLAVQAVTNDIDGLVGDFGVHNFYQYYRLEDRRFYIVPWDPEATYGFPSLSELEFIGTLFPELSFDPTPTRDIYRNFEKSPLTIFVARNAALRAQYRAKIGEILATEAHPARINARVDFIYAQIRQAAYADRNKAYTDADFDAAVRFVKQFAAARHASLLQQIARP